MRPASRTLLPAHRIRPEGYAWLSSRPLHVLVFLTPLVLVYQIALIFVLSSDDGSTVETIRAHGTIARFFEAFRATGLALPGIALMVVLAVWHVLSGDPWRIRPGTIAGMYGESLAWTPPLLVLALTLASNAPHPGAMSPGVWNDAAPVLAFASGVPGHAQDWRAAVALSIGAGLYEELLFRLILITALHAVLFDLFKIPQGPASATAILGSAVAFALYHDLSSWPSPLIGFLFYALAGAYFGAIFMLRGFGVVVGVHAAYNTIILLVVYPRLSAGG
ncbi:MAG: CPBP family intramembrane metalloprotease [Phycisphaeraceae bacterium]|nr:MAG: CPBP family intramembrane metalloprotease [Phycisphaeraceae bacterium]